MGLSVLFVALLIWRMIVIAHGARDRFAFMLCVGIASMVTLYLILNIALLTDAFDVVKILDPFVRYDGLELTGLTAVMGLVMRIAMAIILAAAPAMPGDINRPSSNFKTPWSCKSLYDH